MKNISILGFLKSCLQVVSLYLMLIEQNAGIGATGKCRLRSSSLPANSAADNKEIHTCVTLEKKQDESINADRVCGILKSLVM